MLKGESNIDPQKIYEVIKLLFEAADYDDSGELDQEELGEVMKAYYALEGVSRSLAVTQREVEKAISKYDYDGEGLICLEEFVQMFCDTAEDAAFKTRLNPELLREVSKAAVTEELDERKWFTAQYD